MKRYEPISATRIRASAARITAPYVETTTRDIDWVAVERAANDADARIELNLDEQRAAALLMVAAGYSEREISIRLCVFQRQIARWKQDGKPLVITPQNRHCETPGCGQPHRAHGLCSNHYDQMRRARRREKEAA